MTDGRRGSSGRRRPARTLATAGLVLAVLAELSSAGLLALSGWFISACAVAGAGAYSSFSYLAPSGGVRAFALARIAGGYSRRLVLHAAALERVSAARADFFDRAAASGPTRRAGVWSGELLDRSLADADTAGMALIRSTAPVTATAALTAGGVLAVALSTSSVTAGVLAIGVAIIAAAAYLAPAAAPADQERARAALRAEVVTAVDAWPEMASLGAAGQLAERTTAGSARLGAARAGADHRRLRSTLVTGAVALGALAGTIATSLGSVSGAATLVFVALLSAGVLANAEQLPAAAEARAAAAAARRRLTLPAPTGMPGGTGLPALRTTTTAGTIGLDGYVLPATPLRPRRVLSARVTRGGTLAVTGRSGSGKSTLLRALAASLRSAPATDDGRPAVTAVAADDHVFTGTLGTNFRLADPTLTDSDVDDRLAELWLDRSGLTATTSVGPGGRALSGGEQRRVCVGRAMATRPHVLIVDEPTSGLDEETARHVLRTLRRLPDTTVVLALHTLPGGREPAGQLAHLSLDQRWTERG
jgi:ATP-binding cassette subfamily C protein CydC